MGVGGPPYKPTHKGLIYNHVHSMRQYGEELDKQEPLIKRRDVVTRIFKCAEELEKASKEIEEKGNV